MVERTVLLADDDSSPNIGSPTLTEGTFGADGDVVAVSLVTPDPSDGGGGVDGGADGGESDGVARFVASNARVTIFAADGSVRASRTFAPPSGLRGRGGSTDHVAVVYTGDGVFFCWREGAVITKPDGVEVSTVAVVLQHVGLDGAEGPRLADPGLACSQCSIDLTVAAVGGTAALLASVRPAQGPTQVLLTGFASDGGKLTTHDLSGQTGPENVVDASSSGLGSAMPPPVAARLTVQRGLYVARVGLYASVFDGALASKSGPHEIRTAEAELDVEPGTGNAAIVYSASALVDVTAALPVGGEPDLMYEWRGRGKPRAFAPRRISASTTALDLRINGARTGVVHLAEGGRFFSLVEENGMKIGGDLALASAVTESAAAAAGRASLGSAAGATSTLTAADATHFVVWSASKQVLREVVACDP